MLKQADIATGLQQLELPEQIAVLKALLAEVGIAQWMP